MPWWSWVLIWVGLAALLLLVLTLCAVTLFRKLILLADAVSQLGDRVTSAIDAGVTPEPEPEPLNGARPGSDRLLPAIFQNPWTLAAHVEQLRAERLLRRQVSRDARIVRGKLLRNAPVTEKD